MIQVTNNEIEIINKPLYSTTDIDRIENWLNSTSKTKEETNFIINFNREHFGEEIMGYCDIPCQHRIRKRVELMKEKIRLYGEQ